MRRGLGGAIADLVKATCLLRGAILRLLVVMCGGRCGRGVRVERGFRVRQGLHRGIDIGAKVYFGKDVTIDCPLGGVVRIGSRVTFTHGAFISSVRAVEIGDDSLIGEYTSLRDSKHRTELGSPMRDQPLDCAPIRVGSDVWIGRGCAILSGVSIGDGAVIGANAVVTKDVGPHEICVGIPARPIGRRT